MRFCILMSTGKAKGMNKERLQQYAFALALGVGFVVASGLANLSTAQAQDWRYEQQRRIEQQRREEIRRQRQIERRQGGYYGQSDPYANGGVDENGNIDRNQNGIDDRYETPDGRVDRNQNGIPDEAEGDNGYGRNGGYYGRRNEGYYGRRDEGYYGRRNGGYYGNDGYGNDGDYDDYGANNAEFQKGYQDGLNRGRDDARTNRAMTPNNSSHYRKGNAAYRAGFERGFFEAYRQHQNRGW